MKHVIFVLAILLGLTSCAAPNKYSNFDYSYARSGGLVPVYENLLIKGHRVHYSFQTQNRKIKKDFKITNDELQTIERALSDNKFRMIQEDYKKLYDNISTSINVKKGENSGSKSDASLIMAPDQQRWNNVVKTFEDIITKNTAAADRR